MENHDNRKPVYVVAGILGLLACLIVAGDVWLRSQHLAGLPDSLVQLVGIIAVGLLGWLAPSPLKNPAQQANAVEVAAPLEVAPIADAPAQVTDPPTFIP